jgi:hypothetical protein
LQAVTSTATAYAHAYATSSGAHPHSNSISHSNSPYLYESGSGSGLGAHADSGGIRIRAQEREQEEETILAARWDEVVEWRGCVLSSTFSFSPYFFSDILSIFSLFFLPKFFFLVAFFSLLLFFSFWLWPTLSTVRSEEGERIPCGTAMTCTPISVYGKSKAGGGERRFAGELMTDLR